MVDRYYCSVPGMRKSIEHFVIDTLVVIYSEKNVLRYQDYNQLIHSLNDNNTSPLMYKVDSGKIHTDFDKIEW